MSDRPNWRAGERPWWWPYLLAVVFAVWVVYMLLEITRSGVGC